MRLLTLIRHAKSSWDYPGLTDFERPLNDRGRRDAPRMAQRLARRCKPPLLLLSSPATRAVTTARLFAEALGVDFDEVLIEPRLYEASRKTLLEVIAGLPERRSQVLLFGHNPGLSELAHTLAACPFDELPTCAAVQLQLDIASWAKVGPGCGKLLHYGFPKDGLD
ncbi:histidine phosphatase family protein [Stagnimonas aquatica]|uniref:Histidine phosphatase family protein n=1 Tax=Stagnimonas aquatica TaxID=2689987 RepID=A0A3N0VFE9_9GAMM|nr:histidine phosphatase family protein [Stagnimonas aquatica]ROH91008.1 histidine phosphatase family protein [Stagnimonas aquatica]